MLPAGGRHGNLPVHRERSEHIRRPYPAVLLSRSLTHHERATALLLLVRYDALLETLSLRRAERDRMLHHLERCKVDNRTVSPSVPFRAMTHRACRSWRGEGIRSTNLARRSRPLTYVRRFRVEDFFALVVQHGVHVMYVPSVVVACSVSSSSAIAHTYVSYSCCVYLDEDSSIVEQTTQEDCCRLPSTLQLLLVMQRGHDPPCPTTLATPCSYRSKATTRSLSPPLLRRMEQPRPTFCVTICYTSTHPPPSAHGRRVLKDGLGTKRGQQNAQIRL